MDGEKMRCEEYSGEALEQVDYKTICASTAYSSGLLVFCGLELLLLVAVVVKLTCDCVEYKRTGNLPWCARWVLGRFKLVQNVLRKLCWSVPGIPRPHWTSPRLPSTFCNVTRTRDSPGSVGQGSSGYLTSRYVQCAWDWNSSLYLAVREEVRVDVQEAERRQSFVSSLNSSDFSSFNVLRNVRCEKNPIHGCAMIYRALYGNIQDIFVESCLSNEHIFPPPKALFPILDGKIPRPPK